MKNYNVGVGGGIQTSLVSASKSRPAVSLQPKSSKNRASLALSAMLAGAMLCASGQAQEFSEVIDLGSLDDTQGFRLNGEKLGDFSGVSVSAAGDVNGDGFDDVVIGAHRANPNGVAEVGRTFVLFGTAAGFPFDMRLSDLDGNNGFKIDGEASEDRSGVSVAGIGDFNNDGIDDIIIGASNADPNGDRSGSSYVVYGSDFGFDSSLGLGDLNGHNGLRLDGEVSLDRSGRSVSAAGDINGDGFDDVIIGADGQDANGHFDSGRSYVFFGGNGPFSSRQQLSGLNGVRGFAISGEGALDQSGFSVGGAGDVNNDGYDDLIVGAIGAPSFTGDGRSYVVFGKASGFGSDIFLGDLNGHNGFRLDGTSDSKAGFSVSGAGDVNGDGIADLIIGAPGAGFNGSGSGSGFVVFGTSAGFPQALDLGNLDGSNGFRLDGESVFDEAGSSVAGAGDVNGDGIDDVIIGAPNANPVDGTSGRVYVVFGRSAGFPSVLQLSDLDGTNGFKLNGENDGDSAGISVSAAGDINGDGRPDLIIGAYGHDANGQTESGRSYVIYGRGTPTADDGVREETVVFVDSFELGNP